MPPKISRTRNVFKILGYVLLLAVAALLAAIAYIKVALPNVGEAPQLHVVATAQKIERGRYLANAVCICMDCHSQRDWTRFSGPIKEGTLGMGGEKFDRGAGFPGTYFSKNITPAGLSEYTDGELFRVITAGVDRKGRAMFPVMPYAHYGRMDTSDITSIICYIRTLAPVNNEVPDSKSDFPLNILINTIPKKGQPESLPPTSDTVAYGRYLANASACIDCHTPAKQGKIIEALAFTGGRTFKLPNGMEITSANITFDPKKGLGNWTPEMFVSRFKAHADGLQAARLSPSDANTVMPWTMYAKMTEPDLRAIYAFLKSVSAKSGS